MIIYYGSETSYGFQTDSGWSGEGGESTLNGLNPENLQHSECFIHPSMHVDLNFLRWILAPAKGTWAGIPPEKYPTTAGGPCEGPKLRYETMTCHPCRIRTAKSACDLGGPSNVLSEPQPELVFGES